MKFSVNLIKHLKENEQFDKFWAEYDSLHSRAQTKAYANTVAGCLEIVHDLNDRGIPYCMIGGLSVAFHLHQVNHDAFLNWRGTSDIDILAPKSAIESVLKANGYAYKQIRRGMPGARTGIFDYVKDDNGESLTLGLRQAVEDERDRDITGRLLGSLHSTAVDVYSIPVRVPSIRELIAMKRAANRGKDRDDIKLLKAAYKGLKID